MTSDREAMQQAQLEKLEGTLWMLNQQLTRKQAEIDALRERLAQPEQEPVAWMWRCKPYCGWPDWSVSLKRPADSGRDGNKRTEGYEDVPLYTAPQRREWVGLTEKEVNDIVWNLPYEPSQEDIRAIEAKLKEKNA